MSLRTYGRGTAIAFELGKIFAIIFIVILLIHYFVVTIFVVSGQSMEPNFHDREIVLINKINLFTNRFTRGSPMVLRFPGDPKHTKYIKRLIGMPGDSVEIKNNAIYINGKQLTESYIPSDYTTDPLTNQSKWTLGKGEYFLVGDNRNNSSDSRVWGVAQRSDMIGPVTMILIPRVLFTPAPPY
jgi:signal peptidase I